jgi:CheY-like chemotaxis protein
MAETYQILIVDDEPDILSTYQTFFKKRGYVVETANNGKEGLEKIRNG